MSQYDKTLDEIIVYYNDVIKNLEDNAREMEREKKAKYGGYIRIQKGKLQEYITHSLIMIAWAELGGNLDDIDINSKKIKIPMVKDYLNKISDDNVKKHIENNINDYVYSLSVDKHIFIKGKLIAAIECKAYTENAMIKRIMIDFDLLKTQHPDIKCYLFQLESHLGGDYSTLSDVTYGSKSTHTIMSYFKTRLNIITLLEGERDIERPIHQYFKELKYPHLEKAKNLLKQDLKEYV